MVQEKKSKAWIARPQDPKLVARLSEQTKVSPILTQILFGRGIAEPDKLVSFLAPPSLARGLHNPSKLPGCREAAAFLADAIRAKKKIVVYGDYDVDGMTATAILLQGIRVCGGDAIFYVPNRLEEGYGLNCDALRLFKETENVDVVVTVDCGITSVEEARFAKSLGLQMVITDHHTPIVDEKTGRQILPEAVAIVHPKLEIDGFPPYPFPEICGAFVAFKLVWQLGVEMGTDGVKTSPEMREFLLKAIGYAALGTIADVMPLQDANRVLVRYALNNSLVEHLPLGLKYLVETASAGKPKKLTSDDVSFVIAPRLNAAGREVLNEKTLEILKKGQKGKDDRMTSGPSGQDEQSEYEKAKDDWELGKKLLEHPQPLAAAGQMGLARLGVELLITDRPDRANELAKYVNNLNQTRQKLEQRIMKEARALINNEETGYADDPAFVLAGEDWHPGVIGIVAGRLAETYSRPTVMIALRDPDSSSGSARGVSDSSFNMYDALDSCSQYLTRFGGHAGAAGLGIKQSNVAAFRAAFCDYVANHFAESDYVPRVYIDCELPLAALTPQICHEIEKLAPFGADNPNPVFVVQGLTLDSIRAAGANANVLQAKFRQRQTTRRAVCFNHVDWIQELERLHAENALAKYDVAFNIAYNDFMQQVEMRIVDWRVSRQ